MFMNQIRIERPQAPNETESKKRVISISRGNYRNRITHGAQFVMVRTASAEKKEAHVETLTIQVCGEIAKDTFGAAGRFCPADLRQSDALGAHRPSLEARLLKIRPVARRTRENLLPLISAFSPTNHQSKRPAIGG